MTSRYGPGDRSHDPDTTSHNLQPQATAQSPYMDLNHSRDNLNLYMHSEQDPSSQTYPPPHNEYNPSYSFNPTFNPSYNNSSTSALKHDYPGRSGRTPSPTPSEAEELMKKHVIDWKKILSWRFWFRREWLCASSIFFCSYRLTDALNDFSFAVKRVLCHFSHYSYCRHSHRRVRQTNCWVARAHRS